MKLTKLLPPIIIGNIFEWYDFSLYGYLAPLITKLFFPQISTSLALVATFAIFATGYIARPIGSLVFGYYGDKLGRKVSLSISILLMAFSTCLMGLLPTYHLVGALAGVLLTACRLIQGFAIGGEFTVSVTYIIEHAPNNRKGFFGSLTSLGTFLGLLLGSFIIAFLNVCFTSTQLFDYAWRIPFILSLFLGVGGLFMRIMLPETPSFIAMQEDKTQVDNPLSELFRNHWFKILVATSTVCLAACSFAVWFVWLPSYLRVYSKLSFSQILLINSFNLLIITIMIPCIGFLSDIVGKRVILLIAGFGTIILVIPILTYMNELTLSSVWISQLALAILASLAIGIVPIALFDIFPVNVRCSGISISHNIANTIFGGAAPLFASLILTKSNNLIYQSIPIIIASIITLTLLSKLKA